MLFSVHRVEIPLKYIHGLQSRLQVHDYPWDSDIEDKVIICSPLEKCVYVIFEKKRALSCSTIDP